MAKEKILVVDDEERIVNIVRAYLEKEDYRVVAAHDGATALALARRESPDLVVSTSCCPRSPAGTSAALCGTSRRCRSSC